LASQPERRTDLARAYLYLGVGYVHLGETFLARSRFLRALDLDADLMRRHATAIAALPDPVRKALDGAVEEQQRLLAQQQKAQRRSWTGLALLGGGGAVAGGVMALTRKEEVEVVHETEQAPERSNQPPEVAIRVEPDGPCLVCVTSVSFTANASDPDGEPLFYTWQLGEGATATGRTVRHRYWNAGQRTVSVTVADGLGAQAAAATQVELKDMTGRWRAQPTSFYGLSTITFLERSCSVDGDDGHYRLGGTPTFATANGSVHGWVTSPRRVFFLAMAPYVVGAAVRPKVSFTGELDASFDRMTGTLTTDTHQCGQYCGRTETVTFIRED
jgi:hypothetical protein